jgi:hypothetical protein
LADTITVHPLSSMPAERTQLTTTGLDSRRLFWLASMLTLRHLLLDLSEVDDGVAAAKTR